MSYIAERMAQDLREYADAAEQAGEPISATQELLDEFDALHTHWYTDPGTQGADFMEPSEEHIHP